MFIKICGVKSIEELKLVEKYAGATGIIVKSNSKREISLKKGKEIVISSNIPVYAVSTTTDFNDWCNIIKETTTKYIQIHNNMDIEKIKLLKKKYNNLNIIKSFKVPINSENYIKDGENLLNKINQYKPIVDYILLDSGAGSGKTHNLQISKYVSEKIPVILAGGLNPNNINEIYNFVKPIGVDLSSGVEKDNFKNEKLIKLFIKNLYGL